MKENKWVVSSALALAATIAMAAPATAEQAWSGIDAEIKSCVATVGVQASYADATRVRHAVTDVRERTVGYKLTIETSVYNEQNDAAIRQYTTSCVVNGNNAPMQFTISEAGDQQ